VKRRTTPAALVVATLTCACGGGTEPAAIREYPIRPVPLTAVEVTDGFWAARMETNRAVTIPHIMRENEETGRVANFEKAVGLKEGPYEGRRFNDTDLYKIIEAASYSLVAQVGDLGHPDPALEEQLDRLIALIAKAQEPDGYLFPARTIDPANPAPGVGPERWVHLNGSHELYNFGHLYEAAVAHVQATGKRSLLDVAIKNADLVTRVFGPDGRHAIPGHEEIEVGLVKLYRVTGNEQYLQTAKFFIDQRGHEHDIEPYGDGPFAMYNERSYKQDQEPFVDQQRAVGHAVRAMYLYMGATDVAALDRDEAYAAALDRLWTDMTSKRMYITGGIGARGTTESFGEDYELPNLRAYTETCASVGATLWGHRMFLLHGDARYLDVLERTLYNGALSGVSVAGDTFFYQNPLASEGRAERSAYFAVACCPANISRLIAQLPGLVYATRPAASASGPDLFVNLYVAGRATIDTPAGAVRVTQATRYPWDGVVTIAVDPDASAPFTLNLRVPGWAQNDVIGTDLYRFADVGAGVSPPDENAGVGAGFSRPDGGIALTVNGDPVPLDLQNGFARVARTWAPGDTVRLELPMPVRRVLANEGIADDVGRSAIERGPLVYAAEGVDNGGAVEGLVLPLDAPLDHEWRSDLVGGVEVVTGTAVENGTPRPFTAVPYYAWANRGPGEMAVWLRY